MSADYRRGCITVAVIGMVAAFIGIVLGAMVGGNGAFIPLGTLAGIALNDWRQLRRGE